MSPVYEGLLKADNIKKYIPLVLFISKTLVILFFFFSIKTIHHYLIDPSFPLFIPALKDLNLYLLFSKTILYPSQFLLSWLNEETTITGRVIVINGFRGVDLQAPCMGLDIFATFIALVLAYPVTKKAKWKLIYILAGILMIHLLNIFRISGLLLKNKYFGEIAINHHDLFNLLIYSFVLLLFYFWIKYSSRLSVRSPKQPFTLP